MPSEEDTVSTPRQYFSLTGDLSPHPFLRRTVVSVRQRDTRKLTASPSLLRSYPNLLDCSVTAATLFQIQTRQYVNIVRNTVTIVHSISPSPRLGSRRRGWKRRRRLRPAGLVLISSLSFREARVGTMLQMGWLVLRVECEEIFRWRVPTSLRRRLKSTVSVLIYTRMVCRAAAVVVLGACRFRLRR